MANSALSVAVEAPVEAERPRAERRSKQLSKPIEGLLYLGLFATEFLWVGAIAYLVVRVL